MCVLLVVVFFFKQKTAYEMRISDWSSDVCSSDLGSVIGEVTRTVFARGGVLRCDEDLLENFRLIAISVVGNPESFIRVVGRHIERPHHAMGEALFDVVRGVRIDKRLDDMFYSRDTDKPLFWVVSCGEGIGLVCVEKITVHPT